METLHRKLGRKGLQVIAISCWGDAKAISNAMKQGKYTFPVAMNGTGESDMIGKYEVRVLPSTYLLDSDGRVVAHAPSCADREIREGLKKMGFALPRL